MPGEDKAELAVQGHSHLFTAQAYSYCSQTPIIKRGDDHANIQLAGMERGFPSSQYRWLPFILEFPVATVHLVLIT